MKKKLLFCLGVVLLTGLFSMSAVAEEDDPAIFGGNSSVSPTITIPRSESIQRTYGTSSEILRVISAQGFVPLYSDTTYSYSSWGPRYCTGGSCAFGAPVQLPAGAVITGVELWGCDDSGSDDIEFYLYDCPGPGADTCTLYPPGGLQTSGTPGCNYFLYDIVAGPTVDNYVHSYYVTVNTGGTTSATRFKAAAVYYKLQISPAPGTATFNDVGTGHWAFQFVEALASSGITVGCSPGYFCPNQYVTRAQMAVFLANALGLHWIY